MLAAMARGDKHMDVNAEDSLFHIGERDFSGVAKPS
jgi:hypothetical protein